MNRFRGIFTFFFSNSSLNNTTSLPIINMNEKMVKIYTNKECMIGLHTNEVRLHTNEARIRTNEARMNANEANNACKRG